MCSGGGPVTTMETSLFEAITAVAAARNSMRWVGNQLVRLVDRKT